MRLFILALLTGLSSYTGSATADESLKLEQEADRINYSLGHQIGMDFKRQGIVLDSAAVRRGIEDALAGATPLLGEQDMNARLGALKGQITDDMRSSQIQRVRERKEDSERKRLEAQNFLEANARKDGVITLASGLQYRVIRAGEGVSPHLRDAVTIHYRGRRISGREYDSSYRKDKPVTARVADMILGLKEAVQLMQPGAKWELYIPPDLAYGRDSPLANQAVIVELELLGVDSKDEAAAAPAASGDVQNSPVQ